VWVTPEALEAWAPEKTGRRGRPTSYSGFQAQNREIFESL
jgi:hypothetical protein